jgi:hypothetical protein
MKGKSGVLIAALALLTVGILTVPTISQAHRKAYRTFVTATAHGNNEVDGTVSSPNPRCLAQRFVAIYSPTGASEGTNITDALGRFRIRGGGKGLAVKKLAVGTHFVNVQKRGLLRSRRHKHKCGHAKTTFVVPK